MGVRFVGRRPIGLVGSLLRTNACPETTLLAQMLGVPPRRWTPTQTIPLSGLRSPRSSTTQRPSLPVGQVFLRQVALERADRVAGRLQEGGAVDVDLQAARRLGLKAEPQRPVLAVGELEADDALVGVGWGRRWGRSPARRRRPSPARGWDHRAREVRKRTRPRGQRRAPQSPRTPPPATIPAVSLPIGSSAESRPFCTRAAGRQRPSVARFAAHESRRSRAGRRRPLGTDARARDGPAPWRRSPVDLRARSRAPGRPPPRSRRAPGSPAHSTRCWRIPAWRPRSWRSTRRATTPSGCACSRPTGICWSKSRWR